MNNNHTAAKLSGYILTYNSEKYLATILERMLLVCDELILIDSGSEDRTIEVGKLYQARVVYSPFENYTQQRNFAHSQCRYEYVLWFDSDEIPSLELIGWLQNEKKQGFFYPIYSFQRINYALGVRVRVLYPVYDPEYRERLCLRHILYMSEYKVHETLDKSTPRHTVPYTFDHFTFESENEIEEKCYKYAKLYASQMHKKPSFYKLIFSPMAAWIKWYILKGGYRDGRVGWKLGWYAFRFTFYKYNLYEKDSNYEADFS